MEDMCYERRRAEACVGEHGGEGDCVKEGGGGEGEREKERALGLPLCHNPKRGSESLIRPNTPRAPSRKGQEPW